MSLEAAGEALENRTLNAYLRDWDVSEDRDREIERRAEELLEDDGPKGYAPFGPNAIDMAETVIDLADLLREMLPRLSGGDWAGAGAAAADMLTGIAKASALDAARIDVDSERDDVIDPWDAGRYQRHY